MERGNLVLKVGVGERVHIGDDIEVAVVSRRDGSLRIAFRVPKNLPVHRGVVYEQIHREKGR